MGGQSLIHSMATSLFFLLTPVVHRLIQSICSNYSIEPLAAIHMDTTRQSMARDLTSLVRLVVSMVDPPSMSDILHV